MLRFLAKRDLASCLSSFIIIHAFLWKRAGLIRNLDLKGRTEKNTMEADKIKYFCYKPFEHIGNDVRNQGKTFWHPQI